MVIVCDESKMSQFLGQKWERGIPIEVIPFAYVPIKKEIEASSGTAKLRMASCKAGPCITDNGNFILDWIFDAEKNFDWEKIEKKFNQIPGILGNGLFINRCDIVYYADTNGKLHQIKKNRF